MLGWGEGCILPSWIGGPGQEGTGGNDPSTAVVALQITADGATWRHENTNRPVRHDLLQHSGDQWKWRKHVEEGPRPTVGEGVAQRPRRRAGSGKKYRTLGVLPVGASIYLGVTEVGENRTKERSVEGPVCISHPRPTESICRDILDTGYMDG